MPIYDVKYLLDVGERRTCLLTFYCLESSTHGLSKILNLVGCSFDPNHDFGVSSVRVYTCLDYSLHISCIISNIKLIYLNILNLVLF